MIVKSALQIQLLNGNDTFAFNVPKNASGEGTCGNDTQTLKLSWVIQDASEHVTFNFGTNNKTSTFGLESISLVLNVTLPGKTDCKYK